MSERDLMVISRPLVVLQSIKYPVKRSDTLLLNTHGLECIYIDTFKYLSEPCIIVMDPLCVLCAGRKPSFNGNIDEKVFYQNFQHQKAQTMVNSLGITNDKFKEVNANTISKNKQITLQSSVSAGKISDFRIPIFIFFRSNMASFLQ